jgi:epoxyqueuosine reductase
MHHKAMLPAEQTHWICQRARASGFDLCGVAPVAPEELSPELGRLPEWLARGYAGEMRYLHDPRRADPRQVLDGARSLIVVAINYNAAPRSFAASEVRDGHRESPRG